MERPEPVTVRPTQDSPAQFARYGIAIVGYIVIGYFTKQWVAFTWGPIYFVLVIEVIPRVYRRIRDPRGSGPQLGPAEPFDAAETNSA